MLDAFKRLLCALSITALTLLHSTLPYSAPTCHCLFPSSPLQLSTLLCQKLAQEPKRLIRLRRRQMFHRLEQMWRDILIQIHPRRAPMRNRLGRRLRRWVWTIARRDWRHWTLLDGCGRRWRGLHGGGGLLSQRQNVRDLKGGEKLLPALELVPSRPFLCLRGGACRLREGCRWRWILRGFVARGWGRVRTF